MPVTTPARGTEIPRKRYRNIIDNPKKIKER
nr:MAG TPA: hypothetical protein [Caudoviricetes sp.]